MAKTLIPGTDTPGYYAGLLQSAYYLPTTFINAVWGRLSDTLGRKPILLLGLCGYGVGVFTLGLSTAFWTALLALSLTGTFSGNAVVAKGMIGELATEEDSRAWAYAAYGVVFSAAGIMGTLLGGTLGDPHMFDEVQFLKERPYFVACGIGTMLAILGVIITVKGLGETNDQGKAANYAPLSTGGALVEMTRVEDKKRSSLSEEPVDELDDSVTSTDFPDLSAVPSSSWIPRIGRITNILHPYISILSIRTIIPIFLYSSYALGNSLFHTALPLLAAASPSQGGFGLTAREMGFVMTSLSFVKLLMKGFYSPIHKQLGTLLCFRIGTGLLIPAAFLGPLLRAWWNDEVGGDGGDGATAGPWIGFLYLSAACTGMGEGLMYLSTIMFLTNSVGHEHYGLIHGVSGCVASVVRTVGPTTAGALWEVGKVTGRPWLVFVLCSLVATSGLTLSMWLKMPETRLLHRQDAPWEDDED
ncbi:hypothetical protein HDV00_008247 [Rhizophlyctis rosea]|nr:hypothetical protein HDV00_008247 [Rhizophlyctis rosea]